MSGVAAAGGGHAAGCLSRVPGHRQRGDSRRALSALSCDRERAMGARAHGVREILRGVRRDRPAAASAVRRVRRARARGPDRGHRGPRAAGDRSTAPGCGSPRRDTPAVMAGGPAISTSMVHVAPHPLFRREGDDLHIEVPVAVHEAVLGARIEVPSLDGPFRLDAAAGHAGGAAVPRERPRRADARRGTRRSDRARAAGAAARTSTSARAS